MTKYTKLSIVTFILIASLLKVETCFADSTSLRGITSINVTSSSQNALSLQHYPSFNFGTFLIGKTSSATTTSDSTYSILDLRGGNDGYKIQVSVSDFKSITAPNKKLPIVSLTMTSDNNSNGHLKGANSVDVLNKQGIIIIGDKDSNGVQTSGSVTLSLSLNEKNSSVAPGEYRATVTHNIISGV
ncbi:WxL domain-containing protein [Latilactobacillus fragifolii]|uniref:WxL domain-containing protein n=1 Tax=Latilactobacillus fragifolii TaxID=2814244 RepID=UPI001ABA43A4|nr:WxL domain-containing protein [Latilactobacillus fragifolii]